MVSKSKGGLQTRKHFLYILIIIAFFIGSTFYTIYSFTEGERLQSLHQREERVWRYNRELLLLQEQLDSQLSFWNYTHNSLFNYRIKFRCGGSHLPQSQSVLRVHKGMLEVWNNISINGQPRPLLLYELNLSLAVTPSFAHLERFVDAVQHQHWARARALWQALEVLPLADWLTRLETNAPNRLTVDVYQDERREMVVSTFIEKLEEGRLSEAAKILVHFLDKLYQGETPPERFDVLPGRSGLELGYWRQNTVGNKAAASWHPFITNSTKGYQYTSNGQLVDWDDLFERLEDQAFAFHQQAFLARQSPSTRSMRGGSSPESGTLTSTTDLPPYTSPVFFGAKGLALLHDAQGSNILEQTLRQLLTGDELLPGVPLRGAFCFLDSYTYRTFLQDGGTQSLFSKLHLYDILLVESVSIDQGTAFQTLSWEQKHLLLDWVGVEGHQLILSPSYSPNLEDDYVQDTSLYQELVPLFADYQHNVVYNSLFTDADQDGLLNEGWNITIQEEQPYYTPEGVLVPSLQNTEFIYSHSDGVGRSSALLSGTFRKPMSGYDLIKIAEEWRFSHYIRASSKASFYYALTTMKEEGFLEELGSKQKGNRPEQTIYQLNKKGKEIFIEQMDYYLKKVDSFYFDIDIVTPFVLLLGVLQGKEFILKSIKQQIEKREEKFNEIDNGMDYATSHPMYQFNPFQTLALEHYRLHNQAEIDWLKHFHKMVEEMDFEQNARLISQFQSKK
ncbi:MAG: hypothetical protein GF308_21825 [Candidatus Heimdallarchaeota archaeon]|nr:hypothetical protein [Candidatus Heimdallarchaeota archaeon]